MLIAPYERNATRWEQTTWTSRHTGKPYRITTTPSAGHERPGLVSVKTYRDVLNDYETHPEAKSADPNGRTFSRRTTGLLRRHHLTARTITHIGKEANQLEHTQAGLIDAHDATLTTYDDIERLIFEREILPKLRELGVREVARRTGHSIGAVSAVLKGKAQPRTEARRRYVIAAR